MLQVVKRLFLIGALAAGMLDGCAPKPQSLPITHSLSIQTSKEPGQEVDRLAESVVIHQGLPGLSFAIARRGKIVYAGGVGYEAPGGRAVAGPNSIYDIGSISKQFTAAAILQLRNRRKLTLDERIAKYFPDYSHADGITILDLLTQKSGIPDYLYLPGYQPDFTPGQIVQLVDTAPLTTRPGTRFEYSNTNYVMLGSIASTAAGQELSQYFTQHMFEPLGLHDTAPCAYVTAANLADAGICSSAVDLATWDMALLSGKVLDATTLAQMFTPAPHGDEATIGYGYGVRVGNLLGFREIFHRGEFGDYSGLNAMFPDQQFAIVLLSPSASFQGDYLAERILGLYYPEALRYREKPVPMTERDKATQSLAEALWRAIATGDTGHIEEQVHFTSGQLNRIGSGAFDDLVTQSRGFGALRSFQMLAKDSRYLGSLYTYRLRFDRAVVQMRLGTRPDGTVWDVALERED